MDVIEYIQGIRNSIKNDVYDVALYHSSRDRRVSAGFFSTPREVFCYVDCLGRLAFGGGSTERAIKFIKGYFPTTYYPLAEILYSMWRHGTVHQYEPQIFSTDGPKGLAKVGWQSNNNTGLKFRRLHLKSYAVDGKDDTFVISVNTCQLADDLLVATDKFIFHLSKDNSLRKECAERAGRVKKFQICDQYENKHLRAPLHKQVLLIATSSELRRPRRLRGGQLNKRSAG